MFCVLAYIVICFYLFRVYFCKLYKYHLTMFFSYYILNCSIEKSVKSLKYTLQNEQKKEDLCYFPCCD